jgi:hypothetical protein
MNSSSLGYTTTGNIDDMVELLGIDAAYRVAPRFGLLSSCVQRNCASCTAREACTQWLGKKRNALLGPPKFCPNFDLWSELFYDPGVGHRAHSTR